MAESKSDLKAAAAKPADVKAAPAKGADAAKPGPQAADAEDDAASEGEAPPKGKGKLLIFAGSALVLILAIGGGGAYFFMKGGKPAPGAETQQAPPQKSAAMDFGPVVFHDYPEQLVDLKTGACKSAFLKYQLTVEIPEKDRQRLIDVQARIFDRTQMYLRSQERQDLVGKAGAEKLRDELTTIINGAIAPARANSVLFKKFLLQ